MMYKAPSRRRTNLLPSRLTLREATMIRVMRMESYGYAMKRIKFKITQKYMELKPLIDALKQVNQALRETE